MGRSENVQFMKEIHDAERQLSQAASQGLPGQNHYRPKPNPTGPRQVETAKQVQGLR